MRRYRRTLIATLALAAVGGCASDGSGLFGTGLFADKDQERNVASSEVYQGDRPGISPAQRGVETPSYGGMARTPEPNVSTGGGYSAAEVTGASGVTTTQPGNMSANETGAMNPGQGVGATSGGATSGTTRGGTAGATGSDRNTDFQNPTPRPARGSRG